jgi:lipopolysaccharide/colanic/teichoic acid biosynthesis glycosyltransferase
MGVYPILIDSRPPYLGRSARAPSLLLVPLGADLLVGHLRSRLGTVTTERPVVIAAEGAANGYREEIAAAAPGARIVATARELEEALADVEPSDGLLVVDPRCFSPLDSDLPALVSGSNPGSDPRWASHLVAFAQAGGSGTREYAEFDEEGRVRRIQRYYDSVTWPFISGVAASLVPASSLRGTELVATPLVELRSRLAARGVPGRDLPIAGTAFDLGEEEGLLALSEHFVLRAEARGRRGPLLVGDGQVIHPSARLVGPVIVQRDVVVEENAVVLGPALLGAGARIGQGAIVAQSLVGPRCVVPAQGRLQHRALLDEDASRPFASPRPLLLAIPEDERSEDSPRIRYMRVKSVVDTAVAAAVLLLLLPLLLLIAFLVALDSRGPVLYSQDREGWRGRRFRCWKFRTMHVTAESQERELRAQNEVDGPQFKMACDPRLTRMGRLLRPSNLDELPQILNVLRGEMAFVGPRPSPFRENQLCVDWRQGRLSVRPGITGLWQVCRHDRDAGDFHQWIEYDLLYVRRMSLALDLRILIATVLTLGGRWSVPLSWVLGRSGRGD